MSDEAKDTIRELCGEMAWEHFDQHTAPPAVLWRVDMDRRFVGRHIRTSNWFASKQEADGYVRVQTERGSELMGIVEYHADPAAEIAGLRAENERLRAELDVLRSPPIITFLKGERNKWWQMVGAYDGAMSEECKQSFREGIRVMDKLIESLIVRSAEHAG